MRIKCGRQEFNVTANDLILDNGACYQLITQKYFSNWSYVHPKVSKTLFAQLKKEGKIVKSSKKYKGLIGEELDLWRFVV